MTRPRPPAPPPLGTTSSAESGRQPPDSLVEDLVAGAHLARSKRVLWLLGILWTLGASVAGWAGGKLETRSEIATLSRDVQLLAGEVAVLTSQRRDLVKEVRALSESPSGVLYLQSQELRFAWRQLTQTTSAVYAGESTATRERKRQVAKDFGVRFDRQVERRTPPAAAADIVLGQVAVP